MWRRYVGVHLSPFIAVNSQDDCERLIVEKFDAQIRRAVCSSRGEFPSRQTAAVPSDETEEGGTKVVEVSSSTSTPHRPPRTSTTRHQP